MTGNDKLEPIDVQVQQPGWLARLLYRPLTLVIVLVLALLVFLYAILLYTPPLRISPETTYITEPLTEDGTRVDYFAAYERDHSPPEMKSEDNGYRLIVRALGPYRDSTEKDAPKSAEEQTRDRELYEKLGLDPQVPPTMSCEEPFDFFTRYASAQSTDATQQSDLVAELDAKWKAPWTLTDLPMMGPWFEQNEPVVAMLSEAARKPIFVVPCRRPPQSDAVSLFAYEEVHRFRTFAWILQARANYRIGMGDVEGAIDDVTTCMRLGRRFQQHGTLLERLVGIAVEGIARSIGVAGNRDHPPTAEQLRRFVQELDALPVPAPLADTILAERYFVLNWVQGLAHLDKARRDWYSLNVDERVTSQVLARLSVDWNYVMREVNRYYDRPDEYEFPSIPDALTLRDLFHRGRSQRWVERFVGAGPSQGGFGGEAMHRAECVSHLQRIGLAMLMYEREHGSLPPAFTIDASGKPLHSWRTLLLPYVGQGELYAKLRLDEPWDSPHNSQFLRATPDIYQCPSVTLAAGLTTYTVVVGDKTPFGAGQGRMLKDFGDRLALVVERMQPVMWMDPASDLTYAEAVQFHAQLEAIIFGGPHPTGFNVVLRSGAVSFFSRSYEPAVWTGLLDGTLDHDL